MRIITIDELMAELKAQGVPIEHCAFRCPMCGKIQSADDLIAAGAGDDFDEVEKYLAFSCVGRFLGAGEPTGKMVKHLNGCNWTLGGLIPAANLIVTTPDGAEHPRFEPVSPEEAQAHMAIKSVAAS